jgi:hypothetical protein
LTPFYILLAFAALLLALLLLLFAQGRRPRLRAQAFERRALLSPAERECYRLVTEALGDGYRVFPKVAAAALLQPAGRSRRQRRRAVELLGEGLADLVICTLAETSPLLVVIFRDGRGDRRSRHEEARLRAACSGAGLPTLELPVEAPPSVSRIRGLVEEALRLGEPGGPSGHGEPGIETRRQLMQADDDDEETAMLASLSAAMRDTEEDAGQG